ncbi:MAG: Ig-like domain-containing protein, partial [Thermoplasmata archaeon]
FMTFALDVTWIPENMGAVVFLQADSNGGIHQSANVMFGEPPAITIADTTADPVSGNHTVEGSCTSSRTLSGVFVQIDDGLWVEAEGTAQWIYTIDTRELSDGSHTVHARVYDIAGTYSLPDALTISVRNEEPMPSLEVILLLVAVLSVALFVGAVRRSRA